MKFFEKYILLSGRPPFEGLDYDDIAVIANVCMAHEFEAGATIARKGMMASHFFIAYDGSINFEGKSHKIFSPRHLLSYDDYSGDVLADSKFGAKCLVLSREHFLAAVKNCPSILLALLGKEYAEEKK